MSPEKLIEIAKAFHDGPLMAGDHEFDPEGESGAWCVEVVAFIVGHLKADDRDRRQSMELVEKRVNQIGEIIYGKHDRGFILWPLVKGDEIRARLRGVVLLAGEAS